MRAFFLLCVSRAGLCLGTMMFAGALPTIRSEWQLDAASAGTVQTVFSLTNALALLVASWWCDSLGARRVYLLFSWLGAGALMLFAVFAHSYIGALVLMAFVGLTQGGAYTPALLLAMGMNGPARRGYAIGMILAASSLGYFLSVFIAGWSAMRWGAGGGVFPVRRRCVTGGAGGFVGPGRLSGTATAHAGKEDETRKLCYHLCDPAVADRIYRSQLGTAR